MKHIALLISVACLLACAPAPGPVKTQANPSPYAFDIQLTLTPRTIEKLADMAEMVTISSMFWGEPKQAARARADQMGQINLGSDDIVVQPANRTVTAPGSAIDPKMLEDLKGAPQVLVNVYTARRAHEDNLINCGIYEGPISMAQQKPVEIDCDLIEPPAPEPAASSPPPSPTRSEARPSAEPS